MQNKDAVLCVAITCVDICRPKIPAVFRGKYENFRGVSKFLLVYFTIYGGILAGKHWF
jgi:hypothetical protein